MKKKKKRFISNSGFCGLACDADSDAKLWIALLLGLRRKRPELGTEWLYFFLLWYPESAAGFVTLLGFCHDFFLMLRSVSFISDTSLAILDVTQTFSPAWLIGQILKMIDVCLVFSYRVLQSAGLLGFWTVPDNRCSKSWISIEGIKTSAVVKHFFFLLLVLDHKKDPNSSILILSLAASPANWGILSRLHLENWRKVAEGHIFSLWGLVVGLSMVMPPSFTVQFHCLEAWRN